MPDITLKPLDSVHHRVLCDASIAMELGEFFTFIVPGHQFMPLFKMGRWDGKVRLLNPLAKQLYCGLTERLHEFAEARGYTIAEEGTEFESDWDPEEFARFLVGLRIPAKYTPRDYQIAACKEAIMRGRKLLLSPTSSGKSLIIYILIRWFHNRKILIAVPTTSLVGQMYDDFRTYGWDPEPECHQVTGGKVKTSPKRITISTWQSIYKLERDFFEDFDVLIGDEAHEFKAKSLISIMEKLVNCPVRIGTTGTLDEEVHNTMTLEGLFGPQLQVTTLSELIDNEQIANPKIKVLILNYPSAVKKTMRGKTYDEEMDFLCGSKLRNRFLNRLILDRKGNTIVLFQFVEKHGKVLYDTISSAVEGDRKVFLITGEMKGEEVNRIRAIIEKENDAIILASYGKLQRGVSINRVHNLILASPSKSKIRVLQSLGRGLRKAEDKEHIDVFDLADDLSIRGKAAGKPNHTLRHAIKRVEFYNKDMLSPRVMTIDLEE